MSKRNVDEERSEVELIEQMTKLSLDYHFECPAWLKDYCDLAGCAAELRELIRYSLINEMIHNILTALTNAVRISGVEQHFASDAGETLDARDSFTDLFNTALFPHKCNTYEIAATGDVELDTKIETCVEYLDNVCATLELDNLFVFLETFSKLRLEPLTNPIVVAIHKKLEALPDDAARIAALKLTPDEAVGWNNIPDQQNAVMREIYWTRAARAAQAQQMCYKTEVVTLPRKPQIVHVDDDGDFVQVYNQDADEDDE